MLLTRNKGWIGIDIGTRSVKVVQLVRQDQRLQIAAQAIVPRQEPWPTRASELAQVEPLSSADPLQVAASCLGDFRGRKTAATLSMALCEFHRFDHSVGSQPGRDARVRQAIEMAAQSSAAHLQYDCWSSASTPDVSGSCNVLTAVRTWTEQVCDDIAQLGWSCQLVDGLPLALARAVKLVHPDPSPAPVVALDLGNSGTTFCTVQDGQAIYVRALKGCGFEHLLGTVSTELNISCEEAQRLLQEHGVAAEPGEKLSETAEILRELADDYLGSLVDQCRRTLAHLQGQRPAVVPERIYLLGGGATVKGMTSFLSPALRTRADVWSFGSDTAAPAEDKAVPTCLLGPAIALSALAWERSR